MIPRYTSESVCEIWKLIIARLDTRTTTFDYYSVLYICTIAPNICDLSANQWQMNRNPFMQTRERYWLQQKLCDIGT